MAKKASTTTTKGRTTRPEDDVVCVDLFCGAGGLTYGLRQAGVNVVAGVDFDESCKYPYEENHPGITFHAGDVAELDAETVSKWFGDATVRVLAGCAPCQPFSNYALRYQKDEPVEYDKRWSLLNHFGDLVEKLMPDIVTMENVPTVTKHDVFKNFERKLKTLGYTVWYDDNVDCAKYGLPQRRYRTVLLASLYGDIKLRDPVATETRTVQDVLKDKDLKPIRHGATSKTDRLHTASRLSDLNYKRITVSKPGGSWREWPKELIADCHKKKSGKTYPGVYGRMTWDQPAPTLTTGSVGGNLRMEGETRALRRRQGPREGRGGRRRTRVHHEREPHRPRAREEHGGRRPHQRRPGPEDPERPPAGAHRCEGHRPCVTSWPPGRRSSPA